MTTFTELPPVVVLAKQQSVLLEVEIRAVHETITSGTSEKIKISDKKFFFREQGQGKFFRNSPETVDVVVLAQGCDELLILQSI